MLLKSMGIAVAATVLVFSTPTKAEDFSGVYVGANVGGAWSDLDLTWDVLNPFSPSIPEANPNTRTTPIGIDADGFIGGLHIGFQKQFGQMVLGIEGTASYGALNGEQVFDPFETDRDAPNTVDLDVKGIYTLTGKVGFVVSPRLMAYAKGGLAIVRTDISDQNDTKEKFANDFAAAPYFDARTKGNDYGWTVGFGADYKVTNNILFGVAYDYISVDIDDRFPTHFSSPAATSDRRYSDIDFDIHSVTARLTYLFQTPQIVPLK